jgi:hypothetical protein
MMRCQDCGTPLDEVPFTKCRWHEAYAADERAALQAELDARPLSQKVREAEDFEELKEILADHFLDLED